MAVSGSTDHKSTAVELITDARRLLSIQAEEQALPDVAKGIGLRFLTMMLKDWQVDPDLGTWLETQGTMALAASTASYVFGAGGAFVTVPFEIVALRVSLSGGNEIPMTRMSRADYFDLPNRTTTGFPTQYFYDRQRDNGTLYVWPVPADNNYDVSFTYRRRIMDIDAGTDNFDLPPEWEWAIVNNLAVLLIPVYGRGGTPEAAQVITQADVSLSKLKSFDVSNDGGSVFIARDPYRRY
jgi:hypothetical protein